MYYINFEDPLTSGAEVITFKARLRKGYIEVVAPEILMFITKIFFGAKFAKGVTAGVFFPVIVFQSEALAKYPPLVTHEKIHLCQERDTLYLAILLGCLEYLWARFVLKKSVYDSYLWTSGEQEAYRNDYDLTYLAKRRYLAQFWYLFHKRKFVVVQGGVKYLD
jgi:hypothetical protein